MKEKSDSTTLSFDDVGNVDLLPGRLSAVTVKFGDESKAGRIIAPIFPPPWIFMVSKGHTLLQLMKTYAENNDILVLSRHCGLKNSGSVLGALRFRRKWNAYTLAMRDFSWLYILMLKVPK